MITNIKQFEKLNNVNKKDIMFNYNSVINDIWRQKCIEAQKFQSINFDLEKKSLIITKDLRINQPVKYKINLCLCEAGGDWEQPVLYFKLEFVNKYCELQDTTKKYIWNTDKVNKLNRCFVIIPDETINKLFKTDKGFTAYTDETLEIDKIKTTNWNKEETKLALKWIEKLLTDLIDKNHKLLD